MLLQQQQQQQQAQQAQQGQQTGMVSSSLWSIYGILMTITSIKSAMKRSCMITDKLENGTSYSEKFSRGLIFAVFAVD